MSDPEPRLELASLHATNAELVAQLVEANQAIDAFRCGEVDAVALDSWTTPRLLRAAENEAVRDSLHHRALSERLRMVANASQAFSAATGDYRRLLETVAREVSLATDAACAVCLLSTHGTMLERVAAHADDPELVVAAQQRVEDHVAVRETLAGRPFMDQQRSSRGRLWVALRLRSEPLGLLALLRNGAQSFDDADRDLVQILADHAALAIGNATSFAAERAAHDVADRAVSALRHSQTQFARLSSSGIVGIVVSVPSGQITEANATFLGMIGYSAEWLGSKGLNWTELRGPEFCAVDARATEQLADSGVAELYEKELVHANGTRVPVLVGTATMQGSGHERISFVLDLTEAKQAHAVIARLREQSVADVRSRAIIESAPDAMVITAEDGTITLVNDQFERLFGYARAEIIGLSIEVLVPVRFRSTRAPRGAGYFARADVRRAGLDGELFGVRKDGGELPIEVSFSAVTIGEDVLVSAAIRDVTERKRGERALTRARDAAIAANHELETFSYSVAHDLRSPLRGMSAYGELLLGTRGDTLDAQGKEWLQQILLGATRMATLIDGLLDLSRLSRGELRREPVDLSSMARAIGARFAGSGPRTDLVIEEGLSTPMDPTLALLLLENLLGNAWKFTRKVAAPRIELGSVVCHGGRAFFVRDNGAGFDMAFSSKLFVPLQRLHTVNEFPGTGIGLATVQRILHRHGGRIWADGAVDVGATFYFSLPPVTEQTT